MKDDDQNPDVELTQREVSALAGLRQPVPGSADLGDAVLKALARRGAFRRPLRATLRWAAIAAGLLIAFLAGVRSGARAATPPMLAEPAFAILLLNEPAARWPAGFTAPQIVEEFRDWALALQRSGRLVLAEELSDSRYLVDSAGVRAAAGRDGVNGMFIIYAADTTAALRIARTNPQVRRGGVVTVQAIVAH